MVQCLELYYRQGRSQKDIAAALGVSAATVSRLLKRAFDEGLVRVELDLPRTQELETAFAKQLGVPVLLANVTQQVYQMARAAGFNKEDGSAVVKVFEQLAGVKVGGTG